MDNASTAMQATISVDILHPASNMSQQGKFGPLHSPATCSSKERQTAGGNLSDSIGQALDGMAYA